MVKPMAAISAGLFAAWAAHDAEEVLTMAATSRRALRSAPHVLPIPEPFRDRGISQTHVNLAVVLMAIPVAAASIQGVRTDGRSRCFRGAVLAFGLHGFSHLGNSVMMRGYTTGVATTPVIVIPYWLFAWNALRRRALGDIDPVTAGVALAALPVTAGVHLLAARILGERSVGPALQPTDGGTLAADLTRLWVPICRVRL